jgi:RNA polymerase sigma-70 factor (ECF subfamily)
MARMIAGELRRLYPRVLAKVLAIARRLDEAEDAVQDAVERARERWPRAGLPESPEAWLVTVAGNAWRDRARRRGRETAHADALGALAAMSPWVQGAVALEDVARGWKDDLLRLVFACASPALEVGESAALALSTVLGLSTTEIAVAFAVPYRTMEQRLFRARRRLREHGEPDVPPPERVRDRLAGVRAAIYLLFNEGYWSSHDDAPIRRDLCRLALGLGRSLLSTFPDDSETAGLVALMIFHDARAAARFGPDGAPVRLPDQDRSRWDHAAIAEASALLRHVLALGPPGAYQLEAAISAVHCDAATDWPQIATLYELLERERPTRTVRINRAFAVSRVRGAAAGLELLLDAGDDARCELVRGVLLDELGSIPEAIAALERATAAARNPAEAADIARRITEIRNRPA